MALPTEPVCSILCSLTDVHTAILLVRCAADPPGPLALGVLTESSGRNLKKSELFSVFHRFSTVHSIILPQWHHFGTLLAVPHPSLNARVFPAQQLLQALRAIRALERAIVALLRAV